MDAMTAQGPEPALARKVARLARGESPRVLDLFSGAGGLSLGFQRAGFTIEGAMEIDALASRTHAMNFHRERRDQIELHARPRDITQEEPEEVAAELAACRS